MKALMISVFMGFDDGIDDFEEWKDVEFWEHMADINCAGTWLEFCNFDEGKADELETIYKDKVRVESQCRDMCQLKPEYAEKYKEQVQPLLEKINKDVKALLGKKLFYAEAK